MPARTSFFGEALGRRYPNHDRGYEFKKIKVKTVKGFLGGTRQYDSHGSKMDLQTQI